MKLLCALLTLPFILAFKTSCRNAKFSRSALNSRKNHEDNLSHIVPKTYGDRSNERLRNLASILCSTAAAGLINPIRSKADEPEIDFGSFKLPYFHENLPFKQFIGKKATIVFNMKIDDPQTVLQFPDLAEIFKKYKKDGLNIHAFPTEQGWFEPDDDETCRLKAKEFYDFGSDFPYSVVFDKVDILGPSAHPFYQALTKTLPTPNGYSRITLNYEKFLLNAQGIPVRRYPRKLTAYEMEPDILALLNDQPLPAETPQFQKSWREAKREVEKGEYSFRFNYNYYDAPNSMYKYDPNKDKVQ